MDPELIARMVQDLLAQSDQTRVADPRNRKEPEPQSDAKNLLFNLLQGGDPTFGLGSSLAGATPERPDIKLQIAMGLLTGGSLKHLFKGAASLAGKGAGKVRSLADEAFDTFMERIGTPRPDHFSTRVMTESRTARMLDRFLPGKTVVSELEAAHKLDDAALLAEVRLDRRLREGRSAGPELLDSELSQFAREDEFIRGVQQEASIEQLFQKFLDSEIVKGARKPKG